MLRHYIKCALRNFKSNKVIFGGSLLTICLGALCVSLLFLYVSNEFTRNDFHKREGDIYLAVVKSSPESQWEGSMPSLFFGFNHQEYPEVETATRVMKYKEGEMAIQHELNTQYPEGIVVDSTFFQIFDFDLKIGNKKTVLLEPDAILITESLAKKLFGSKNPMGKKVNVSAYMKEEYIVKGILEKIPPTSSLSFDFVLPDTYVPNQYSKSGIEFLLMNQGFNQVAFTEKIAYLGDDHPQFKGSVLGLVPFESVYFNESKVDFMAIFSDYGDRHTLYVLMIIMAVILIISIMNISNLQMINTNTSVKFIVLSVINGAQKRHVFYQKLTELSLLVVLSAFLVSLMQWLILPEFNDFTDVPLSPPLGQLAVQNMGIILLLASLALIYPVVVALNIPIINSLKNQTFFTSRLTGKKSAVVVQYTLTFVLLISSIVVIKQLDMMLHKDLGFSSENIIKTKLFADLPVPKELFSKPHEEDKKDIEKSQQRAAKIEEYEASRAEQIQMYEFVKNEMRANPSIALYSQGNTPMEAYKGPWKLREDNSEFINQNTLTVAPGHKEVFDFKLIEGRFFEDEKDKPYGNKLVINEAAKKYWDIDNISDSRLLNKYWDEEPAGYEILGVVKDFNYERLSLKPEPLVMVYFDRGQQDDFLIRFEKGATMAGLQFAEKLFHRANTAEAFAYSFLTDQIANMYEKEKQLSILYIIFTVLALLISSIGLFTIALYDTQRRVKEIGIRKVNGAKTGEILTMLNKDFSKYVLMAFVLACPITYLLMQKWLENFAYKTSISWWIFVLAGVFTLLIALLTVTWQSYRAATANPVNSLRTE